MNSSSSIVLVNGIESAKQKLENKMHKKIKETIGARINSINLNIEFKNKFTINYDEIAEDITCMITKFKNTTGMSIESDAGILKFEKNDRTANLKTGEFYKAIENYFKRLNKNSYLWCASTMLEDEWTEEPLEMKFRVMNLDAANRGTNVERIFIFRKSKIQEFKNNKTLKIYMQSNIKTMFVNYDEVLKKNLNY